MDIKNFSIPVIVNGHINPIFCNANRLILNKYVDQLAQKQDHNDKIKFFEHMWLTEFSAILEKNSGECWECITFSNPKDLIIFKLKFG